jgi:hypothetical protein
MSPEKNDLTTSTPTPSKIKSVSVKRRPVQPAEEKSPAEKTAAIKPKKSKLAVRIVGREFKVKEKSSLTTPKPVRAEAGLAKATDGKDHFHRASHRLEENKTETARHKKKKAKSETEARPVGVYRKISIFFILLTLALLAAAFYFFFVSLTIEVSPKSAAISDKLEAVITNNSTVQPGINLSGQVNIAGSVEQIPVKQQKTYQATGAKILGDELDGQVTIINNYSQDKTLVATTRLLSPDGKLFRIKNQITVPAGGQTKVDIYVDAPTSSLAIAPTTFTIPGLWAGLQDKIYGKSDTAFVYKSNAQKFIQQSDIDKALQDLKASLIEKVNSQFTGNYRGYDKVMAQVDKDSLLASTSAKANQKIDSFSYSLSALVDVSAFQSADVLKMAQDKLISEMPAGEKLIGIDQSSLQYNLTGGDYKNGTVDLEVPFTGTTALTDADTAVDKTKLVGLTGAQIQQYLEGLNKFSDIKLFFTPPFFNKAPSLVDRIKIVIK